MKMKKLDIAELEAGGERIAEPAGGAVEKHRVAWQWAVFRVGGPAPTTATAPTLADSVESAYNGSPCIAQV